MFLKFALFILFGIIAAEDYVHNPIQYHSQSQRGTYNWGYDTGLYGAHQFHQENRDDKGRVRGRYGYTDPDGKLRLTYYTSGADGYKTWAPNANQDIGNPLNENKFSRNSKYVESDDSSLWESASKRSQNVYEEQHVHKHEQSQQTVKGQTKIETKGQTKVETKGQTKIDTKGQTKVETKGQIVVDTKSGSKDQIKGQIYQKKSYFSPAEYYKSYGQQQQQQTQEVLQQQQQQVRQVYNKPEPITPMQYRHIYQPNYAPSARYSRCYCI